MSNLETIDLPVGREYNSLTFFKSKFYTQYTTIFVWFCLEKKRTVQSNSILLSSEQNVMHAHALRSFSLPFHFCPREIFYSGNRL